MSVKGGEVRWAGTLKYSRPSLAKSHLIPSATPWGRTHSSILHIRLKTRVKEMECEDSSPPGSQVSFYSTPNSEKTLSSMYHKKTSSRWRDAELLTYSRASLCLVQHCYLFVLPVIYWFGGFRVTSQITHHEFCGDVYGPHSNHSGFNTTGKCIVDVGL